MRSQAGVVFGERGAERSYRSFVLPLRRARLRQVRAQHAVRRRQLEGLGEGGAGRRPILPASVRLTHGAVDRGRGSLIALPQRQVCGATQCRCRRRERHVRMLVELG